MSRLIDVSLPISSTLTVWPGDPPISVERAKRISRGDAANVSLLSAGSHSGTHVDPPSHFLEGAKSVDQLDPSALIGPAWVAEFPGARGEIPADRVESAGIPTGVERLLIKTPNSGTLGPGKPFRDDFACLSVGAAEWCVSWGLRLVGVDYLSVERRDAPAEHPVHRTLLAGGIVIVEGLDLSEVGAGPCDLLCLPLRLAGGDGAPARVFVSFPE